MTTVWGRVRERLRGDATARPCVCGHTHEAHEHYRAGTDCALCSCPRYRRS